MLLAGVEYERLPEFCTSCQNIGYSLDNCLKSKVRVEKNPQLEGSVRIRKTYVAKSGQNEAMANNLENRETGHNLEVDNTDDSIDVLDKENAVTSSGRGIHEVSGRIS